MWQRQPVIEKSIHPVMERGVMAAHLRLLMVARLGAGTALRELPQSLSHPRAESAVTSGWN